ncbi:unnamed protein product, partial [Didymodactylos carnosus]
MDIVPNPDDVMTRLIEWIELKDDKKFQDNYQTNLNIINEEQHNVLLYKAIDNNLIDIVEEILKHGHTNINKKGLFSTYTPLGLAVRKEEKYAIVQCLIKYNADVNYRINYEDTPIMEAIKYSNWPAFRLLHENGADID